jgi:hypothetical protein
MDQTLDLDALMKAAAQAARRNDAGEAASLLRRALATQEQALGPDDAALAPNLNNLAMMLERLGDNAEAERCYRRAYGIARRAVGPKDSMTAAARANLVEFLHATGRLDPLRDDIDEEFEKTEPTPVASADDATALRLGLDSFESERAAAEPAPAPPPRPAVPPPAPSPPLEMNLAAPPTPAIPRPPQRVDATPAASRSPRGTALLVWMILGAAAVGALAWVLIERGSSTPAATNVAPQAAPERPAEPPAAAGPPPAAANPPATTAPSPAVTTTGPPTRAATESAPANRPASTSDVVSGLTVDSSLCERLNRGGGGGWRCDPFPASGDSDAVYYYTRVKSPRDATIRHRWTYQGKPVQTVSLQVRANAREGFRTFSHQRVAGRPGQWEVAVLSADGMVVDTRQFTVAK